MEELLKQLILEMCLTRQELNKISCELVRIQEAVLDSALPRTPKTEIKNITKKLVTERIFEKTPGRVSEVLTEIMPKNKIAWSQQNGTENKNDTAVNTEPKNESA